MDEISAEKFSQAERMARNKLCYDKCFCPKLRAKDECGNCLVFASLRDYYLNYVIEAEPCDYLSRWSWKDVATIAESGKSEELFSLGDEKKVVLSSGEEVTAIIIGFNHDNLADGGKAGMTFALKDALPVELSVNCESTNAGGWRTSKMRTDYLERIYGVLPPELKERIKPVVKVTGVGGDGRTGRVGKTVDKLFLFSGSEVDGAEEYVDNGFGGAFYGAKDWAAPNEGKQYPYFVDYKNLAFYKNAERVDWWLRSPYIGDGTSFCYVDRGGEMERADAKIRKFIRFGFCI